MVEENLESVLDDVWKRKTTERLIPLKRPILNEASKTARIDIYTKKIEISRNLVDSLNKAGVSYENSLDGLIEHEITHYFLMPGSLTTQILEINTLKGIVDSAKRDGIINFFNDVAVNLNIVLRGSGSANNLGKIYKNLDDKDTNLGKLLRAYYHQFAEKIDFGADSDNLDSHLKDKLNALNHINFLSLNKSNIAFNLLSFSKVIEDLADIKDKGFIFEDGNTPIANASEEEKERALRELVDILDIEDYRDLRKLLDGQNDTKNKKDYSHSSGNTYSEKADPITVEYYRNKAMQYPIRVLGLPLSRENTYREKLSEWDPSHGFKGINLLRSGGRIIPGVTKRWVEGKYNTYGSEKKIPDSIIVIDSSGSMTKVSTGNSYAAIAAISAAIQYMDNGAKVDVVNFSSIAKTTKYHDNRSVMEAILEYQGDGTNFPRNEIGKMLSEESKDLIIITDGEVDYLHSVNFFDTVDKNSKNNRVSFVYITDNDPSRYKGFVDTYKSIMFHFVKKEEGIPNLVIGDTYYGP